jgi:hypothetical protein
MPLFPVIPLGRESYFSKGMGRSSIYGGSSRCLIILRLVRILGGGVGAFLFFITALTSRLRITGLGWVICFELSSYLPMLIGGVSQLHSRDAASFLTLS